MATKTRRKSNTALVFNPAGRSLSIGGSRRTNPARKRRRRHATTHHRRRRRNPVMKTVAARRRNPVRRRRNPLTASGRPAKLGPRSCRDEARRCVAVPVEPRQQSPRARQIPQRHRSRPGSLRRRGSDEALRLPSRGICCGLGRAAQRLAADGDRRRYDRQHLRQRLFA